jgi:hypothetical protein
VLLVGGKQSPAVFRHLNGLLQRLLPCAELVAIAGASHLVHEDQPSAYTTAVLRFLSKQQSVARSPSVGAAPHREGEKETSLRIGGRPTLTGSR